MDDENTQPEQVSEISGPSALEQRQQLLAHHVKMVARKLSHALFVFGAQGGLGKSRTILKTLKPRGGTGGCEFSTSRRWPCTRCSTSSGTIR